MNIARAAVGIAASLGAGQVIGNAIKSTTPPTLGKLARVGTVVGTVVIGGMVGSHAEHYAKGQYDAFSAWFKELKKKEDK